MAIRFHEAGRGEWSTLHRDGLVVWYAGREGSVRALLDTLPSGRAPRRAEAAQALRGLPGHFAVALLGDGWGLVAVDEARAYPLLYAETVDELHLSGCARAVRDAAGLSGMDETGVLEFLMSGFVTAGGTVIRGLHQLQAGEALLWSEGGGGEVFRYYLFHTREFLEDGRDGLVERLGLATDAVFDRLVQDLDGRPALLPLSAGLDSRLVAAKLVERGYDDIRTFSYGTPGNHEAAHARKVAETLGVPWRFVPISGPDMRAFHESSLRREYWNFCDGLASVPNPQDIVPLLKLRDEGGLPGNAVLINGQSGDFSCGAHIPRALTEADACLGDVFELLLAKHFALWRDMLTPGNTARLRAKMQGALAAIDPDPDTPARLAVLHDCWEWQERQSKYVVNGQRIYDFLGLDWRLPLWEAEWNDFWPRVPVEYRLGRGLHRDYLRRWDYRGLFSGREPVVSHWPGASVVLFAAAQIAGLFGRGAKDAWYRHARWFGHYGFQWRSYHLGRFLRDANQARNVLALFVEDWVGENLNLATRHALNF
ncbi:asparagine synthase-related protein [Desulfocurvus sp. DL9XJH121]